MEGGLCFFHANPNKAVELGRIGGKRRKTLIPQGSADPLPKVETVAALRETVSQLIDRVISGRLNARVAAGVAPLLNLQLRTLEFAEIEPRIAELEKRLLELEVENDDSALRKGSEPRSVQ
jgi:hypothetical protein